ncbi:MAG: SHOCT domain-containing protein [Bacilli bacterium]|jgi:cytochrome c biogenesis factor|nr:SHOCT domain-containing protein [Bacilli bacterium]
MNKSLLLVARILSLISGIVYCISIVGIPLGVLNIIASNKFAQAEKDEVSRETVRNWSIYLIFTDMISGILGLVASESNKDDNVFENDNNKTSSTVEQRLNKLSRLYESGAISREEYEARRREIIEEI